MGYNFLLPSLSFWYWTLNWVLFMLGKNSVFYFETVSFVVQAGLELLMPLPQPPK